MLRRGSRKRFSASLRRKGGSGCVGGEDASEAVASARPGHAGHCLGDRREVEDAQHLGLVDGVGEPALIEQVGKVDERPGGCGDGNGVAGVAVGWWRRRVRWTVMPARGPRDLVAVTSMSVAERSMPWRTPAERWLSTAPGPQAITAASCRASSVSAG